MADFSGFQISLGNTSYPTIYNAFVAAMQPYATEIENGRQGQASLAANFGRYILASQGLTMNLAAGGYRITGLPAPVAADEPATKAYADGLAFSAALPSQAGNGGLLARTNGTLTSWDNWWGSAVAISGAASLNDRYAYHADTSGGPFSVNLPPATSKSWVLIRDVGNAMSSKNLTIVPNGTDKVYGSVQNSVMNVSGETLILVVDATKGWVRG